MPTYTYRCDECGQFDWIHPISTVIDVCPKCGFTDIHKVFNSVGISFRGSGFYSTEKNTSATKSSGKTKDFDF